MNKLQELVQNDKFNYLLLIIVGALFFIPFLGSVHLFDWDEANFAEAAREMIVSGNFMRVTIDFQPFWEKPPLFFWFQVISMKMFGVNEFAARFVDAFFGIITLLAVYTIGKRVYDRLFGLLWAFAFVGSFLPHMFYKSGIMDPVFNLFIFLGITFCIWALRTEKRSTRFWRYFFAGLITGLAVLTKGPVAFLLVALVFGVYWTTLRFRKFFFITDILSYLGALCLVAFLFFGIETFSHGWWFIEEFTRYQIRLLTTGDAGHGRPFYFHFVVILLGCFPASFFAIRSFVKRIEPGDLQKLFNKFMIILFWVVLILFSLVKTKTVLYSSLTYFPLMYLAALHAHGILTGKLAWKKSVSIALAIFASIIALVITVFPIVLYNKEAIMPFIKDKFAVACLMNPVQWSGFEFLLGIGYAVILIVTLVLFAKRRFAQGFISLVLSSAVCLQLFMLIFAPKIEQYSQGGPIAFFKEHANDREYVRSLFKSYTDLFYGNRLPLGESQKPGKEWLLTGDIDKPAYFVGRVTQEKKYLGYNLKEIKREYGFIYYVREIPLVPSDQTVGTTQN